MGDMNYIVWHKISQVLNSLDSFFQEYPPTVYRKFQQFAARISKNGFKKYGWNPSEDDGHLGELARAIFVNLQAKFETEDETLLNEANRRFHEYCSDPVANAGVLPSLGSTADANLKKDTIRWALESIALQDFFYPIRSVHDSCPAGRQITWSYFKAELAAFKDKVGNSSANLMNAAISSCTGSFASSEKADEVEKFFKENSLAGTGRKIKQIVENIRINAVLASNAMKSPAASEQFWDSLLCE